MIDASGPTSAYEHHCIAGGMTNVELLTQCQRTLLSRIRHWSLKIYFYTSGVHVDLFEFERLIERNTSDSLDEAIQIHRGGLLKDWEEESWFCEERENSLAAYLDAMNTLADTALQTHDY